MAASPTRSHHHTLQQLHSQDLPRDREGTPVRRPTCSLQRRSKPEATSQNLPLPQEVKKVFLLKIAPKIENLIVNAFIIVNF